MLQHGNRIRHERGNDYVSEVEEHEWSPERAMRLRSPRRKPRRFGKRREDQATKGKHDD